MIINITFINIYITVNLKMVIHYKNNKEKEVYLNTIREKVSKDIETIADKYKFK